MEILLVLVGLLLVGYCCISAYFLIVCIIKCNALEQTITLLERKLGIKNPRDEN